MAVFLFYYTHYTIRGGHSGNGFYCGAFYDDANNGAGYSSWFRGAALSFKLHIMLFMVVLLTMALLVGLSLLVLTIVLVIPHLGLLALLYHSSNITSYYYPLRGGHSSTGTYCGTFYILAVLTAGGTYWYTGAALS